MKKKNRLGNVWDNTAADDVIEPTSAPTRIEQPEALPPSESVERRKIGRPPGKRTNPDYQSVTTFLHKQTYLDVQRALIGGGQDFGDIVDDLLKEWLKENV